MPRCAHRLRESAPRRAKTTRESETAAQNVRSVKHAFAVVEVICDVLLRAARLMKVLMVDGFALLPRNKRSIESWTQTQSQIP